MSLKEAVGIVNEINDYSPIMDTAYGWNQNAFNKMIERIEAFAACTSVFESAQKQYEMWLAMQEYIESRENKRLHDVNYDHLVIALCREVLESRKKEIHEK